MDTIYRITATLSDTSFEFMIKRFEAEDNNIYYKYTDNSNIVNIRKSKLMIPDENPMVKNIKNEMHFMIHCKKSLINEAKQSIINHVIICLSNYELVIKAKKKALKNTITNYKN